MIFARLVLLLAVALLPLGSAVGASQTRSAAAAGDCTSLGGAGANWTNPGNAFSNNAVYATASVDGTVTDPLRCMNYGFAIPLTATVVGIEVFIERRSSSTNNGGSNDGSVFLVKGGTATVSNRATATDYPTTDQVEGHGGALDLWGTTWTPAEINAANFGAQMTATKPSGAGPAHTIFIDHVYITVHFSEPPPAPTLVSPADGAILTTPTPTFDWTDVVDPDGDAVTYEIQADDSGCGFASLEINQTGLVASTFTPGAPLPNGTYCWRARAMDALGAAGPWSATRDVTINAPVPVFDTRSPAAAGDCTSLGGAGANWTNPGNAFSSNNLRATASVDGTVTDPLRCMNYGFSIPLNAVITGIEVFVERNSSSTANGGSRDNSLFLVKAGAQVGASRATATPYTTTDVVEGHGGAGDAWGTSWTPAEINAVNFGAVFTATKPNGAGAAHTVRVDHISIRVHYYIPAVPPGAFNVFESGTAALAINGVIRTKIAGATFSLDVVAIESGAQFVSFADTVQVDLLGNNTLGVALDANNCPTSSTPLQSVNPDPAIAGGRSTVNFAAVVDAWRDVRVRVRWPVGAPTVTSCSTDNFAIRPNAFTGFAVSDDDWLLAGTTRTLNDVTFGVLTHKAGRPVSVRADAVNAAGPPAVTGNYIGSPTVTLSACAGAACTSAFGTLTLGAAFVAGQLATDVASYDNVGAFRVQLTDTAFASVDAADGSTLVERSITSAAIDVGRFVPDHFTVSLNGPEFGSACGSFTYVGQKFNYTSVPVITVTARNSAGNPTTFYDGSWWRITDTSLTPNNQALRYAAAGSVTLDVGTLPATTMDPAIAATGSGAGTLTFSSGTGTGFNRSTPAAPFDADLSLAINVIDADGVSYGANPARFGDATAGNGMAFSAGKSQRFGRLRMQNAYGSGTVALPMATETQYWNGTAFVLNAQDSCTSFAAADVVLADYTLNLGAGETTIVQTTISFTSGLGALTMTAPGAANSGSVLLTPNLTVAGLLYLKGKWTGANWDQDPAARATFGLYGSQPKNFIFFRENY